MEKYYVYRYKSPKNKYYIGITSSENRRKAQHRCDEKSPVYAILSKYGEEAIEYKTIYVAFSLEEAKAAEIYFIEKYDAYYNGYNRTLGGDKMAHNRKLKIEGVLEIKNYLEQTDLSFREIAKRYCVTERAIRDICYGWTWTTVTGGKLNRDKKNSKGNAHYNSKLTEEDVVKIKTRLNKGESRVTIAEDFKVSVNAIKQIYAEINWKGVGPSIVKRPKNLTDPDIVKKIYQRFDEGVRNVDIMKEFNVSKSTVARYKRMWKKKGSKDSPSSDIKPVV